MKKQILISCLLILIFVSSGLAQPRTYFNFEDVIVDSFFPWAGATWEGVVDNPSKTGINVSDKVGLGTSGSEKFAGMAYIEDTTIDLSESRLFTMDVYSAEAGFIKLKLEKKDDNSVSTVLEMQYSTPGEWQNLSFNFAVGQTDTYSKLTIILNSQNIVQGQQWYLDNLKGPELTKELVVPEGVKLSTLTVDVGSLYPVFDPLVASYQLTVPEGTNSVNVSATPKDANANVSGTGTVDLSSGSGAATIVVTAVDGITKMTYTVKIRVAGQTKFNPGNYATLQNTFTRQDLLDIVQTPGLKGVQLRYFWKSIETAEGVYDFSKIESDLAVVSEAQKYLVVFFEDKSFKNGVRYTPQYLWDEYTVPSGKSMNGEEGFVAKRWDSFVVDKISDLMEAMAQRFDAEPWFEGVAFQETAIGLNDYNSNLYNYTPEAYRDALIDMLINTKTSFKSSQVFWYMNFLAGHQGYIRSVANAIAPHKVLMGGPDILPDSYSLNNLVYSFYPEFKDKMTLFCSNQFSSYHHSHSSGIYDTKFWTMEELYLWGRDNLYIDYTFWNVPNGPAEPGAYDWDDAKPVILKYSDSSTSVKTSVKKGEFEVYPNPGNGVFTISSTLENPIQEVSVFDFTGKKVYQKTASGSIIKVDISGCSNGIYLLKVNETVTKVIKE